ncbi:hypothetical protein QM480_18950 [Flectobacillus sp. DC10W]|uniref:Cytochrome C Planctomycete-type domain-containing protein n=1 Tax=Flectobacillus longus TaxID=2984207 RepID=A0ABT6YSK7_9BACT|nr:DUF2231 domain-containing protein [Flectobacillus longus]MDI9866427.1 hypothetical protein [Flectobacillus longus]
MILLDIFSYLGRIHPLVVHLPIGFLVLAAIFDILTYKSKYAFLKPAVPLILLLGGISATIACVMGWLLSQTGDYDYLILRNHKYTGISVAVVSFIFYGLKSLFVQRIFQISDKAFSGLLLAQMCLLSYSGHQGGNLTHGEDYLSLDNLTASKREKPSSLKETKVFEDLVLPVVENKCQQCHQNGKKKGDLLLLTYQDLLKGGKNGPAIILGSSAKSELFRRVTLPSEHKEFMPTDGKPALTPEEIALLKWWLDEGKGAENIGFTTVPNHEKMTSTASGILGIAGAILPQENKQIQVINPDIPKKVDEKAIQNAIDGGFNIRFMNHNPVMLDVSFINKKAAPNLALLVPIAKNIVWLNLNQLNLSNKIGSSIALMLNLEKLRLEKNNITDGFAQNLLGLKHLNALNLNETQISNVTVNELKKLKSLNHLYVWNTKVLEILDNDTSAHALKIISK